MLINHDGEKLGIVSIDNAIKSAAEASLDLVQVSSSDSSPVVCKILDYGKYMFNKKKSSSNTKSKPKRNTTKEIKFRPSTDVGDKTKITIRFRGREILNSDMGLDLLNRVREELKDISQVDQEASLDGRQLLMVLAPLKKK